MATLTPSSLVVLHEPFARRMKQACDANSDVPAMNDGRLVWMRQRIENEGIEVSLQTVMRWYYGAAMPRQKKLIMLSKILGVSPSWLSLGRDERTKVDTSSRRISTEGAVNALAGLMQIAGVPCAFPEADDPRADSVHFYSIIGGRQHPIHVASSGTDAKATQVTFQVPTRHSKLVVMLVVPFDQKSVEVWHIPSETIEHVSQKDSDMRTLTAKISGRQLSLGRSRIAPISDFKQPLLV